MTVLDPSRLQATHRTAGTDFVRKMRDVFERSARASLQSLRDAIASDQRDDAHRAAHTLKGAAATVGLESMRRLALDLESRSRDASEVLTPSDADPVADALEHGLRAIDAWLDEIP